MKLLVIIIIVFHFLTGFSSLGDELLSVVVLFRHGDRTPIKSYRYDHYDESYWPLGYGQLTKIGKRQQYALGRSLRKRYDGLLPEKYDPRDILVQSSNFDRCLMSAAANLAGLYPPRDHQVWLEGLAWQPIPIHTAPEEEDAVLAQKRPCPRYDKLYDELMATDEIQDIGWDYLEFFDFLSANSGEKIDSFDQLKDLYDTLYVEDLHNLTLPVWTRQVFSELAQLSDFAWSTYTFTVELARLRTGPLVDYITSHFENVTTDPDNALKFLMLSAHDSTIANLLSSLNVFDGRWPPYASSVIFELRKGPVTPFVNLFYDNTVEIANITLANCRFNCDLSEFREIVAPVRMNLARWREECLQV
ncbi:hypothetical protein NQ318_015072 [Aromia moschata]|uniref:acid phosphatase n=1 Tax=Aromia moschata TaxID=1265417 RepID=A0AAV8YXJ8_9CUCU|nr:hypothetical protein NQ318_015072 [Aromia moschata]